MESGAEAMSQTETGKDAVKGAVRLLDANVEFPLETKLRDLLKGRIIGQEKSTSAIASIIASRMYSIAPRKGPIAVLYLSGPTGVGKTETCHALSQYFFGNPDSFVKISGEDYQDHHASRNLFGATKTYVGYGEPTPLNDTSVYKGYEDAIEQGTFCPEISNPDKFKNFSIVLIDEVEKMHPAIHQNFLGIFDKGIFQFPTGKEHRDDAKHASITDFSNTIFILTSNIGERENAKTGIGFNAHASEQQESRSMTITSAIKDAFSPEFRGRVTEFFHYEPLDRANIQKICEGYTKKVSDCLKDYGIELVNDETIAPGLVDIFAEKSKKMEGGARGLQKIVQDRFDGALARIIANGQLNDLPHGQIQIHASYSDHQFHFTGQVQEPTIDTTSPAQTFGDMLSKQLIESEFYRHKEREMLMQSYRHISRLSYTIASINYRPYLDTLTKKMQEYGFKHDDIESLDREIWEKVTRESGDNGPRQSRIKRSEEDIFYPFSLQEMRNLMIELWKSQVEVNDTVFKKKIAGLRLVLIQEVIRKTMIAFMGKSIQKDQSIWIGQEIHRIYVQSTASLR